VQAYLPLLLVLLSVLAAVHLISTRVTTPAPILLAIAGAAIALIPGLPHLRLDPDIILVLFLPPLLYADAFNTSWIDFRRWLRPIMALAVGLVALTTFTVGVVTHYLLPQVPWPVCFILGAIVSPTDTVAVQAVIEKLRIPRRVTAILGGESLVNDATGLVGVQVGVAVALSGTFAASHVALEFLRVAGGGVVVGALTGLAFALVNRFVRAPRVLFVFSLLSPYLAYVVAHTLDTSGVLAVVVAGFVVAWRIHQVPSAARVELYSTWGMLVFVLEGLCFVIIGLETPYLLAESGSSQGNILVAGLWISATVIVSRILWCLPNSYVPLYLFPRTREREGGYPPFRGVLLVSWCGVRGVVSLAAALALPRVLADGTPFPGRQEVITCTLIVILVTLIAQGLTLQPLIRLLGLRNDEDTASEVCVARQRVLEAGIARLDEYCSETSCPISVHHWRTLMSDELVTLRDEDEETATQARSRMAVSREVRREVFHAQETALLGLRDAGTINDKSYMQLQLELDRSSSETPTLQESAA